MYKIYPVNELGKQTVSKLYENRDRIDFSPYYQRFGGLWSPAKRKLLIDTIINGFDIPKFYFNYFIESDNPININNKLYAIIDGKQRMHAIFDFLDNKFELDSSCKIYDKNISLEGYNYQKLLVEYSSIAKQIKNYVLDVIFIVTDEDDRLEEMFLRLNGGLALTNAEKRNAINSFLNRATRDLIVNHSFFTEKVRFKNPRFQHNDLLIKLMFVENNNGLLNLGNKELENFVRSNANENNNSIRIVDGTKYVLDKLSDVFLDNDFLLKGKGIIPVYYQFIKEHINEDSKTLNEFLNEFEELRISNRNIDEPNTHLQEFDLYNQQGVHRFTSLDFRYKIIKKLFDYYMSHGNLQNSLYVLKNGDDDLNDFDEL